jgi:hypothetical protein
MLFRERSNESSASADHLAGGQGIYLVFWFGSRQLTGLPLRQSPKGEHPSLAADLEEMLKAELPAGSGDRLSIVVLDVARRWQEVSCR